jgi:hypothetical protein
MSQDRHHRDEKSAGHVTETPDVSHIRNIDVTHEMSDVSVEGIVKFIVGLTVMTAVTFGLMWALFRVLNSEVVRKEEKTPPGPMAMSEAERLPPEPRLQAARGFGLKLENGQVVDLDTLAKPGQPQAEYRTLREQWEAVLLHGKMDASGKPVALPIAEAMKQVLEGDHLPRAPETRAGASGDSGIRLPTAASSGRMTEKKN